MVLQAIGKLKLAAPFQPQWAEVPLWLSARGLTTGPILHSGGAYEVRTDFISHSIEWFTSEGTEGQLPLGPTSVASVVASLFAGLQRSGIDASINPMPQEIPGPIPFGEDREERPYDREMVNAWWRILLSVQSILERFQGRFQGKAQPIGLMWGTLDIRLALYNGKKAAPGDANKGFIRRNAMNAELMEMGWWSGDRNYRKAAFYSFVYPEPPGLANAKIAPTAARWDPAMGEFLLDYDVLRTWSDPDGDLLAFLLSSYEANASSAGWDAALLGSGRPE
jgi:hypothetical protein